VNPICSEEEEEEEEEEKKGVDTVRCVRYTTPRVSARRARRLRTERVREGRAINNRAPHRSLLPK